MPKLGPGSPCDLEKCTSKKLTTSRNHCTTCHEFFNSDSAFDKHRIGEFESDTNPRRCMTIPEMVEAGMSLNDGGYWVGQAFDGRVFR